MPEVLQGWVRVRWVVMGALDLTVGIVSFSAWLVAVAQLVELQIVVLAVAGSSPVGHPILPLVA